MADCTAAELLLRRLPQASIVHGDKGYDSNAIRRQIEGKGAMPSIPPKANGVARTASPRSSIEKNAIERMFGRLKDFRRIATRYDRSATNFLAAVCIAAAVSYWLRVPDPSSSTVLPQFELVEPRGRDDETVEDHTVNRPGFAGGRLV